MVAEERDVAKSEMDSWREAFLAAALGREASSTLNQLLAKHKILHDKVRIQ